MSIKGGLTTKTTSFEKFGGTYTQQGDYLLPNLILLAEKEGITEQLKATDMMLWVQKMNNIRNRAMEFVNIELIYAFEIKNTMFNQC